MGAGGTLKLVLEEEVVEVAAIEGFEENIELDEVLLDGEHLPYPVWQPDPQYVSVDPQYPYPYPLQQSPKPDPGQSQWPLSAPHSPLAESAVEVGEPADIEEVGAIVD